MRIKNLTAERAHTYAVDGLAVAAGVSPNVAAKAIALHEMGHAYYQQRSFEIQPGDNASLDAKVAWCMEREGMATFYAFKVMREAGGGLVAGTHNAPDLYDKMLAAIGHLDPRSSLYEIQGIAFATEQFNADPRYVAFCKDPENWKQPSYLGPDNGNERTWHSGTTNFIGMTYKYPPTPGGYWQEVPPSNPSNVVTHDPTNSMDYLPLVRAVPAQPEDLAWRQVANRAIEADALHCNAYLGSNPFERGVPPATAALHNDDLLALECTPVARLVGQPEHMLAPML